jgi:phosphotriesterase-related protein
VTRAGQVPTFTGSVRAAELGTTLIHEHVFVGHPELDANYPHPEWDEAAAVERAVHGLARAHALGIRTVVDLTVPGLGRDVRRVAAIAGRVPVHLVAATGYYTADVLPAFFRTGPGCWSAARTRWWSTSSGTSRTGSRAPGSAPPS